MSPVPDAKSTLPLTRSDLGWAGGVQISPARRGYRPSAQLGGASDGFSQNTMRLRRTRGFSLLRLKPSFHLQIGLSLGPQ